MAKSKAENDAIWNRTGFRSIIIRLVKEGYFETSKKTKLNAAKQAPFEEAIRILSIENSINPT